MSHRDLAAHLAQPLGTVKTWVRRGLANLRSCVEECMGASR
jgi:RNA polymerase sigma-70 factor (ECF subfamily)